MKPIKYFYADHTGGVHENPQIWPLAVLNKQYSNESVFRFAFDSELNKFYIQDQSFREKMSSGDKDVWHFVNESIRFIKMEYNAGFLDREFGDPPETSTKRTLSQYSSAWQYLTEFLQEEMGSTPVNMSICEYVPSPGDNDPISLELPGCPCDGSHIEEPSIRISRYLHKDKNLSNSQDIDWDLMNEVLATFYLRNLRTISNITSQPDDNNHNTIRLDQHDDPFGYNLMIAYSAGTDIHIIKANNNEVSENNVRSSLPNAEYIIAFSYLSNQNRLVFHNHMPTEMAKNETLNTMLSSIKKMVAKSNNVKPSSLILSFDPTLSTPYVSKLSNYVIPWEIGQERFGENIPDMSVVEVPIRLPGRALLVSKGKDEPEGLKDFRAKYGMAVEYPFIAVDNRIHNLGIKYKAMLDALAKQTKEETDPKDWIKTDRDFSKSLQEESKLQQIQRQMTFMLKMGMPRMHIIDMYADRNEPTQRAEYRKILRYTWSKVESNPRFACKTAAIGPAYDVNSWWHIGLQDELNQAQHAETVTKKPLEPYNLKKFRGKNKTKTPSYEELLKDNHDKNLGYMKSTEQLLWETRI